jgi:hypothetical protein
MTAITTITALDPEIIAAIAEAAAEHHARLARQWARLRVWQAVSAR